MHGDGINQNYSNKYYACCMPVSLLKQMYCCIHLKTLYNIFKFVIQIIENIWETKEIRKGVNLSDQQPALPQLALGERKVAVSG